MKKCGIYAIENLVNGKLYIGSSVNVNKRKNEHFNKLRKGIHHSRHLQRAFNKYGEISFIFRVIEYVDETILREKEKEYILKLNSLNRDGGYNVTEATTNGCLKGENHPLYGKDRRALGHTIYWEGKRIPEEIKVKMRKPKSEQAKKNMSLNHADVSGENNPMYGKEFSKEHREKISKSLKVKMLGENNPMFGRKRTGQLAGHSKKVLQLTLKGEILQEFINITEASKTTGRQGNIYLNVVKVKGNQLAVSDGNILIKALN